jgi:membrane associated rhomboid family serine protease
MDDLWASVAYRAKALWVRQTGRLPPTDGDLLRTGLLGVNAAVFVAWQRVESSPKRFAFMVQHFAQTPVSLHPLRWHTLLTSMCAAALPRSGRYSHIRFWHLGFNMLALWSFTPPLVDMAWGRRPHRVRVACARVGSR